MGKTVIEGETVTLPKEEYRILKELFRTVKRQNFLLRIDEAEKNLRAGRVKRVSVKEFIDGV
ncbi:MAG: hypothetical protein AABY87_13165 [bacterium]